MKIKTDGFKLTIDLCDLVESLGKDDHVRLARLVAADKQLFAAVLECVASDSRLGHYFEDDTDGSWWFDGPSLLELREKLKPMMSEIARGAVTEALRQRNDAQQKERESTAWAWRLYHAWPDRCWTDRPATPYGWSPPPEPERAEVDALLSEGKADV